MLYERAPIERHPEHLGQKAALDFYRKVPGVRWTYVSPPGWIAPGERTGVYRTGDDEVLVNDQGESRITMEDYAVALIDEAGGSPEAVDRVRALWHKFHDHLETMPDPEIYEVIADWRP